MFRSAIMFAVLASAGVGSLALTEAFDPSTPGRFRGEAQAIGLGKAWSWVETDADGRPTSMGITMTEDALRGLPAEGGHTCCDGPQWTLPLPIGVDTGPVKHVVLNWNPQGHPPEGVYTVPHFDFHFYTITEAERLEIKHSDDNGAAGSTPPPAEQLPPDYIQAPGVVGNMGCHWIDAKAPELNGQPFTATFLYGSYNGKVTFIEPMITKATLEAKAEQSFPVKAPARPSDVRFVPSAYGISFDADAKTITISMEDGRD